MEAEFRENKGKKFLKLQRECWRRAALPIFMYLCTGLIAFSAQAIQTVFWRIFLGVLCILAGAAFNAHLTYRYGREHYNNLYAGNQQRSRNVLDGLRPEREFRFWKGFVIGFLVGVPVIVFGLLSLAWSYSEIILLVIAGWAIIPVQWLRNYGGFAVSGAWCILAVLLPIVVSGVFYITGAMIEKKKKDEQAARAAEVARLAEESKIRREQTEEQRRKTLQSKKKK